MWLQEQKADILKMKVLLPISRVPLVCLRFPKLLFCLAHVGGSLEFLKKFSNFTGKLLDMEFLL